MILGQNYFYGWRHTNYWQSVVTWGDYTTFTSTRLFFHVVLVQILQLP